MSLWYVFINIDDVFMVWTKSEKQLKDFMSDLNQKHASVKFDYKFDYKQIEFLDTLIDVDQQNKLQTTLFWKSSNHQNFLNAKSEHPYSLKKSITNLSIKDTKKMSSYSKFRRLANSIENNCSINKNVVINNASLYQ